MTLVLLWYVLAQRETPASSAAAETKTTSTPLHSNHPECKTTTEPSKLLSPSSLAQFLVFSHCHTLGFYLKSEKWVPLFRLSINRLQPGNHHPHIFNFVRQIKAVTGVSKPWFLARAASTRTTDHQAPTSPQFHTDATEYFRLMPLVMGPRERGLDLIFSNSLFSFLSYLPHGNVRLYSHNLLLLTQSEDEALALALAASMNDIPSRSTHPPPSTSQPHPT